MKKIAIALLALAPLAALADYRIIPYGQQYVMDFTLRDADATALTSGLTLTSGDCKVSKAGGADANCGTLPTAIASSNKYLLTVSSTEASTSRLIVMLNDTTGTAYYGREFAFDTCGDPSARYAQCPWNNPTFLHHGTCSGASTTTTCRDATLTQSTSWWSAYTAIVLQGQAPRCIRGFDAANDELQFPAAASTAASQPYDLVAEPSCRTPP